MNVVLCVRRGDQENQMSRHTVQRFKFHAVPDNHSGQPRFADCGAFSVGNGNSASNACGTFLFSEINLFSVALFICDFSAGRHQGHHLIQGFRLCVRGSVKTDTPLINQICNPHEIPSFSSCFCDFMSQTRR